MSLFLKYILIFLIILLVGTFSYLGYLYFNPPGVQDRSLDDFTTEVSPTPNLGHISLLGKILLGADIDLPTAYCSDEYYLVSGDRATWIIGDFVRHKNLDVQLFGRNGRDNDPCYTVDIMNCGCGDHLVVEEIKVVK